MKREGDYWGRKGTEGKRRQGGEIVYELNVCIFIFISKNTAI